CAEEGEFGSFFKADDLDAMRVGADIGIGGLHAIDVGPYLDGFRIERGADEGSGEIRASASDGGLDAGFRCSNEAAHERNFARLDDGRNDLLRAIVDLVSERKGPGVLMVGYEHFAGVHEHGLYSAGIEGLCAHLAGEPLTVADYVIR